MTSNEFNEILYCAECERLVSMAFNEKILDTLKNEWLKIYSCGQGHRITVRFAKAHRATANPRDPAQQVASDCQDAALLFELIEMPLFTYTVRQTKTNNQGDFLSAPDRLHILRVPGGWIINAVFVPEPSAGPVRVDLGLDKTRRGS